MSRHSDAGPIAGLCFLACAAIGALALLGHVIHPHLPALREFLLHTITPQFAAGMFAGVALCMTGAALFAWGER